MSWFRALWMVVRIGVAGAVGKAGFPRIGQWLMPDHHRALPQERPPDRDWSVGAVLRASANNFRHNDEWEQEGAHLDRDQRAP